LARLKIRLQRNLLVVEVEVVEEVVEVVEVVVESILEVKDLSKYIHIYILFRLA
jgi:hypothetical protein